MIETKSDGYEVRIAYVWCDECSGIRRVCLNCQATGVNPCPVTELK